MSVAALSAVCASIVMVTSGGFHGSLVSIETDSASSVLDPNAESTRSSPNGPADFADCFPTFQLGSELLVSSGMVPSPIGLLCWAE